MKNLRIFVFVVFVSIFIGTVNISAQSTCSCGTSCSASQTCPDGYTAVCTCSASNCSSSCNRNQLEFEFSATVLDSKLREESVKNIGKVLSKAFGKIVTFEPNNSKFKFEYSASDSPAVSHWDILEYLDKNGTLKINGHDLEFLRNMQQTLLKGGEFSFCTGSASVEMILSEINFLTGKKYSTASGDPKTKITVPIKGFSSIEILENLSKASQTTIVEN